MSKKSGRLEGQKMMFARALEKIKPDVTEQDRRDLAKQKELSFITISRYLNGKVYDLDTAASILTFLRKKIQERKQLINC